MKGTFSCPQTEQVTIPSSARPFPTTAFSRNSAVGGWALSTKRRTLSYTAKQHPSEGRDSSDILW